MFEVKILADSINRHGNRLTTMQWTFPRFILAEINTHKMISKNSASSRAQPVEKQIKKILDNPFVPFYWGQTQKGMQAEEELNNESKRLAKRKWLFSSKMAVKQAKHLLDLGLHKQLTNRIIEPYMWHTAILTGTEFSNLFNLRAHKDAQPEFKKIALMAKELYFDSKPRLNNEWHLPLVYNIDFDDLVDEWHNGQFGEADLWDTLCKISIGRNARVSFLTHDGKRDPKLDIDLSEKLFVGGHMSPYEHVARPMTNEELELFKQDEVVWKDKKWNKTGKVNHFLGNLNGWVQYRKLIPGESDILGYRNL